MPRMVSAREIVGKRIVAFRPNSYLAGEGEMKTTMHEPSIVLDDGSVLFFMTEEHPDGADYGVYVGRHIPKGKRS
jgi:hypothetical protein